MVSTPEEASREQHHPSARQSRPAHPEAIFTYGAPQLKFGPGASDEIGFDLSQYGVSRALVVTDPGVAATGTPQRVADQMANFGIEAQVFDGVHVEPTDESMKAAIEQARASGPWDAFVAVGGGSSIDTAKAINLLLTNPGELMDYINAPVGQARAPVNPLKPLIAVPTTTGTGAESTTVCVLDVLSLRVKTGISHVRLRPTLAVVDPLLTLTQPAGVTASSGMDILCHALESYTARWYTSSSTSGPSSGCRTAAPTPSPTCGRRRPWDCSPPRSAARFATGTTARPGRTWPSRPPSRGWASATRGSTSRTPTPTRSRAG